jgi:hypothetical protein
MSTREVEPDEWLPFFDAFSSMHQGVLVTLEVTRGASTEVIAREAPLEDIHVDAVAGTPRISVVLLDRDDELSQVVVDPEHVYMSEREGGVVRLEISSATETTAVEVPRAELPKDVSELLF